MSTETPANVLTFVKSPISQAQIDAATTNYIMIDWCNQIYTQPEFNEFAARLLLLLTGETLTTSMISRETSHVLCKKLKELICRIDWLKLQAPCEGVGGGVGTESKSKAKTELNITYHCAEKDVCISIPELLKRWGDVKFRDRFPPADRRRVTDIHNTLSKGQIPLFQKYNPDIHENCLAFSFLPVSCAMQKVMLESKEVPFCTYVIASLLSNLFGLTSSYTRYRVTAECIPNIQIIQSIVKKCNEMDIEVLRVVYFDIWNDVIAQRFDQLEIDDRFQKWLAKEDHYHLTQTQRYRIQDFTKQEICQKFQILLRELKIITEGGPVSEQTWTEYALEKLDYLGANYISPFVIEMFLRNLFPDQEFSSQVINVLAICFNLSLFLLSFYLSWKVFLLLYPEGRQYLMKMFSDPVLATSFVLSLSLAGIPGGTLISYIYNVAQYLNLPIPSTFAADVASKITQNVLASKLRTVNLDKMPSNFKENLRTLAPEFPRPFLDGLKYIDEQLESLRVKSTAELRP